MTDEKQAENVQEEESKSGDMMEVGAYAAGGAAAGAGASILGGVKLIVAGSVMTSMLPVVAVGAVTGVAAYGLKKSFWG
jgi:hypothetical protein